VTSALIVSMRMGDLWSEQRLKEVIEATGLSRMTIYRLERSGQRGHRGELMKAFLRRTFLGGAFTVLLVTAVLYLLWHALSVIRKGLEQIGAALPFDTRFAALAALLLLSFIFGLVLDVPSVRQLIKAGMARLAARFPFSGIVYRFGMELAGLGESPIRPALAVLSNGFVIEELDGGRYVVFVPTSPKPSRGSVHILSREHVHLINASHYEFATCVSYRGVGMKNMLQGAGESASA
jgi:uncharacterized membrane protein